jgi:hypothetical protein
MNTRSITRIRALSMSLVCAVAGLGLAACASTPPDPFPVGCYDYAPGSGSQVDLQYLGPIDTVNNAQFTFSTDGTCSGGTDPSFARTVVRAADLTAANARCQSLVHSNAIYQLNQPSIADYESAPSDVWFCPGGPVSLPFPPGCYDYAPGSGTQADLKYLGPIDSVGNAYQMFTTDGTCGGPLEPGNAATVIRAADLPAANAKCQALRGHVAIYQLNQPAIADFEAAPPDVWFC